MSLWEKYHAVLGKAFFLLAGVFAGVGLWYRYTTLNKATELQAFLYMWEWWTITVIFCILSVGLLWDE